MAKERKAIFGLSGMASAINPLLIEDGQAQLLLNYDTRKIGAWSKRKGYRLFGQQLVSEKPILGMAQFTDSAGTQTRQVVTIDDSSSTNSDIFYTATSTLDGAITTSTTTITVVDGTVFATSGKIEIDGDEITYTGKTGNDLTGVTGIAEAHLNGATVRQWRVTLANDTAGLGPSFVVFLNRIFRFNGTDTPKSWNGNPASAWDATQLTSAPNGTLAATFLLNIYVSGVSGTPDRVFFSSDPDINGNITWDTTNDWIDINPSDGSNITALEPNQDLLIFKDRGLYRLTSKRTTEPDLIIDVGAPSKDVVTTLRGITFWLGRSKEDLSLFAYTGGFPEDIGFTIQNWIDAVDQSTLSNLASGTTRDNIFFYLGDSLTIDGESFSNVVAVYSLTKGEWFLYSLNHKLRKTAMFVDEDSAEKLCFGDSTGKIFKTQVGQTDDGSPIAGRIIGKEFAIIAPEVKKTLTDFVAYSKKANHIKAGVYLDDNRKNPIPIGAFKKRVNIFPNRKDEFFTVTPFFTENSKSESELDGFSFWYDPEKGMRSFRDNG